MAYRPIPEEVRQAVTSLLGQGLTDVEIARRLGGRVSRTTVARLRRQHEAAKPPPLVVNPLPPPNRRTPWNERFHGRLRKVLELPPAPPPERRHVPRRTYAWYVPEELGEAVKAQAEAAGVAPSQVVEWILYQAREQGWLATPDRLETTRRFRAVVDALQAAVYRDDREAVKRLFNQMLAVMGHLAQYDQDDGPQPDPDELHGEEAPGDAREDA